MRSRTWWCSAIPTAVRCRKRSVARATSEDAIAALGEGTWWASTRTTIPVSACSQRALASVGAGAEVQVQGTINGYGERVGGAT